MTTELVIETAEMRLLQTTALVEWLTTRYPDRADLKAALDAIETARTIIEGVALQDG